MRTTEQIVTEAVKKFAAIKVVKGKNWQEILHAIIQAAIDEALVDEREERALIEKDLQDELRAARA